MDMKQAMEDAVGAAMKAIQAAENAARGSGAHPRVGDLSYASFRKEGCTQCKRCTVECPFGAINEDEQRYPQFNESRCRRCGTCMGACPVRVISFENYSIDSVNQQLKAVDVPDEFSEKPRILVLACENDAYPALDMAAQSGQTMTPFARVIPVRCLGSVSLSWITDSLNSGYDGVVLRAAGATTTTSATSCAARPWRPSGCRRSATPSPSSTWSRSGWWSTRSPSPMCSAPRSWSTTWPRPSRRSA